jgi:Ca2+-binding RTX toxin-like protein
MLGGAGNDTMLGQGSMDTMDGGFGSDAMSGGARDDVMQGGFGFDCMKGDAGNDLMWGDRSVDGASDFLGAADTMLGGDGADTMYGQGGRDQMDGGAGGDVMDGGIGNDLMTGGSGNDTLTGGGGSDTFAFRQGEVQGNTDLDVITDWNPFDSNEKILLCGQIDPFFTVAKVEIGIFDNFANLDTDVRIGLSNGQFILLLDVGGSGDWAADDVDPEHNATNADNFARAADCPIDCTVECGDSDGGRVGQVVDQVVEVLQIVEVA